MTGIAADNHTHTSTWALHLYAQEISHSHIHVLEVFFVCSICNCTHTIAQAWKQKKKLCTEKKTFIKPATTHDSCWFSGVLCQNLDAALPCFNCLWSIHMIFTHYRKCYHAIWLLSSRIISLFSFINNSFQWSSDSPSPGAFLSEGSISRRSNICNSHWNQLPINN